MSDEPTSPPPSDPPSDPPAPPPPPSDAPPPPPPPAGAAPESQPFAGSGGGDSGNRTLMVILSYLGPFALIPFLTEKDNQDIQWHSKHGLVLFLADIIISILMSIVSSTCIGCIFVIPVGVIVVAVHVICIVKGINGERFLIPWLSDFADRF